MAPVVSDSTVDTRLEAPHRAGSRVGWTFLLLVALFSRESWAQELIGSVTIECDLPRCQQDPEMDRLLSLTDLVPGRPYLAEQGQAAVYFLEQTGFFEEVALRTIPTVNGPLDVILHTTGRRFIRRVSIDSGLALESEIEQRIFMRPGEPFDPSEIERQVEAIIDLFEEDGYYGTEVSIEEVDVEVYQVDLEITVVRGERLDIRRIYLRGNQVFPYRRLRSLILNEFGFFRTFTADAFEKALTSLLTTYREEGYYQVQLLTRRYVSNLEEGYADLFIEIREGPRWEFTFTGNRHFTDSELMDRLSFSETGFFGQADISSSIGELQALYRTAGYYFAEVVASEVPVGPERRRVEYGIYEGPQAEIRQISFEGNDQVAAEQLVALLSTREYSVLETGGYLQPEQMDADIRAIESFYHNQGYLSAYVPRWTVLAEEGGGSLFVTLFVHEGPRTLVNSVRFQGNQVMSTPALQSACQLDQGDPFSPDRLSRGQNALFELYARRGYRPRQTQVVCITDEGEELENCPLPTFPDRCLVNFPQRCHDRSRDERHLIECARLQTAVGCELEGGVRSSGVTVEYRLDEGELITVGEILITGNTKTRESVIRREFLMREGEPYDDTLLLEGQSNLRSLGLFNSVSVRTIGIQANEPFHRKQAAIVIALEEKTNEFIEFRVGLASQNTVDNQFRLVLATDATYADRNFLGRAEELRVGGSFQFDVTGVQRVAEGEFILGAGIVYLDPRFYWLALAHEPWEAQVSLSYLYDLVSIPQNERKYALTLQARREFRSVRGLAVSLEADFMLQETRTVPQEEEFDQRLILQLAPSLIIDRRDNPINPTEGIFGELALSLADDFIAINTEQYTRIRLRGSAFWPMFRHIVLGAHFRFGFALGGILSLFDTPEDPDLPQDERLILPPGERFRLGGVSGLRGFADNGLGPVTPLGVPLFGDVVLNGVAELRYPILRSANLYGAAFLEAGQLTADFVDLSIDGFRYSAGLGVRWLAFGLVPVVLDYGLALDRHPGEDLGQWYLNVGYTF